MKAKNGQKAAEVEKLWMMEAGQRAGREAVFIADAGGCSVTVRIAMVHK
jgi:hypothetical protein